MLDVIERYIKSVNDEIERRNKEIISYVNKEYHKSFDSIAKEFKPIVDAEAEKAYKKAIDGFYNSYKPKYYNRTRGLEKLFDVDGGANPSVAIMGEYLHAGYDDTNYDSSRMHGLRSGGGNEYLYEKVFEKGFHGGAHDSFRMMRYRKPYKLYYRWGAPASQSTAPEVLAEREIDTALNKGNLQEDLTKIAVKHYTAIIKDIGKKF